MASSSIFHECESNLDLGFLEKTEPWLLASRFFPSKVGGRPSWLDLKNIPQELKCEKEKCGKPLTFLLQIYAPIENDAKCFHREIFVFMCSEVSCHQGDSTPFRVLRNQLCHKNEFYPQEPPQGDLN